jgi:hypothetical protein
MKRYIRSNIDDFDEYDEYDEGSASEIYNQLCEEHNFFDIENAVADELGVYLDFSSVRGDEGEVFIFSDEDHENSDSDMWMGDDDALITKVSFSDYVDGVKEATSGDEGQWEQKYRSYLEGLIEGE